MEQHIVSAVLLRRWAASGKLSAFDLQHRVTRLRSPRSEGFVDNYTRHDAEGHEARWAYIENKVPYVFDLLDSGRLHDDPRAVERLKDFLALHVARSLTTKQVYDDAFAMRMMDLEATSEILNQDELLDEYSHDRTGLYPAGPQGRAGARSAYIAEITQRVGPGSALFGEILVDHYTRFRSNLSHMGLEISVASAGEFLIGDDPVQTVDTRQKRVGIRSGVTIPDADTIVLPLGPRHAVAINSQDSVRSLPASAVETLNRIQVITAQMKVYFRPGAGLESFIETELDRAALPCG